MSSGENRQNRRWVILPVAALLLLVAVVAWAMRPQAPVAQTADNFSAPKMNKPSGAAPVGLSADQSLKPYETIYPNGVRVVKEVKHDTSPPLRDLPIQPVKPRTEEIEKQPPTNLNSSPIEDPVVQRFFGALAMPTPIITFDGVPEDLSTCSCAPPDTNGDVGPNHYVQTVNTAFQIWDKNGTSLFGPAAINTLFAGHASRCETENDGDPIVLYDPMADRWFINQFVSSPPYYQCIAVSTTADPTGSYHRYAFLVGAADFYDYQKFGVWPDGYYMTANVFPDAGGFRPSAAVFDRAAMLTGAAATFQEFNPGNFYGNILPSDMDGTTPPPAGSPNYFATISGSNNRFRMWEFHVDWSTPANSTFTGPVNLTTALYDANLCGGAPCVPQQGTTRRLDTLYDRTMFRLAYRNFGSHESLVTNHSVDVGGDQAGIRWYEVRDPDNTPFIYQQGTYAPDALHRWMGSAAQDRDGNLAVGYSVSSAAMFPAIRYAGRLATDPLGVLAQGEAEMFQGTGSQTNPSRWGDYSSMSVDPVDDCTFWYTQEYYATNSTFNWKTRIGKFKFPSCGQPQPTVTGTPPTATATSVPQSTATPMPAACNTYTFTEGSGSIVAGTDDTGNHCDDCATYITLPFPIKMYEQTFLNASLSSNGSIQFQTADFAYGSDCLPVPIFEYAAIAYWDDLVTSCTNCGIYTSISGSEPERIFNVEWRAQVLSNNTQANFEIRMYEAENRFDFVYGTVIAAGNGATIGVQRDGITSTEYACDMPGSITPGLLLTFTAPECPPASPTPTLPPILPTMTNTPVNTPVEATSTPVEPTPCTVTFTDVENDNTFYSNIRCLACRGIMSGYSDGSFRPNNNVTRGQLSKIVANSADFNEPVTTVTFQDVPADSTFYLFIERMAGRGIISGYPCGSDGEDCVPPSNKPYFRPNANATRGQISKIVSEARAINDTVTTVTFQDVPANSTFWLWIERLANRGYMGGYPCGSDGEDCVPPSNKPYFRPNANATRGQTSKIVANTFYPNCVTP
jgi:hypothetical protein